MMEVYIDSIYRININKIELYAIIDEEYGVGIPLGYMLMEKKSGEDSNIFSGEMISCCARFFGYARSLDINPMMIYTDKCTSELGVIKVCILGNYLMTGSVRV